MGIRFSEFPSYMIMKNIILIIIVSLSFCGFSQKKIYVFDSITGVPIEYATIKFSNINDGTYSNLKGMFELPLSVNEFSINSIGYESKTFSKSISDTIFLKPKEILLDEVFVKNKITEIYGKKKSKLYIGFNSNSESLIFAKRIKLQDNVSIRKIHFDIKNDNKKKKIRLLIFNEENGKIKNNNIITKNIVSELTPNQNTIVFDVISNNIILEKGKYYIAIEVFDLGKTNSNSSIKIGCYQTKNENESLTKPVFNDYAKWKTIKTINGKKEYSFNFYLTLEK